MINIVLFEPEIPGNTGNIMRTCVATNSKLHLIEPLGFSLEFEKGNQQISKNKDGEYYFLTRYGHQPHTNFDYSDNKKNLYFIFGKESTGIPPKILVPFIDRCIRIPMSANVRALNLSNTVAIVVYEALRQQNYNDLLFDEPHKSKTFIEDSVDNK